MNYFDTVMYISEKQETVMSDSLFWEFIGFLSDNGALHAYIKNMLSTYRLNSGKRFFGREENAPTWISESFNWESSPEGHSFWSDLDCEWQERF